MTADNRLKVAVAMILLSAVYAMLVATSPELASAIAAGYIAILLTAILLSNRKKRK